MTLEAEVMEAQIRKQL